MKIISGGQTGADTGALMAARHLGIETGGFAPKGWLTENGPQEAKLRSFGLSECTEDGYPPRTRMNLIHSDGTLLVGDPQIGGTRLTYELATELKKPLFQLAFPESSATHRAEEFRSWLQANRIEVLNVAGNRESEASGITEFTRAFVLDALSQRFP